MVPTEAEKAAFMALLERAERRPRDYGALDALRSRTIELSPDRHFWPLGMAHNHLGVTERFNRAIGDSQRWY